MPEHKNVSTLFDCEKMGSKVTIETKLLIHRSSNTGQIDKEFPVKHSCDHTNQCGVGVHSGHSTSYDWKQCIHPDLKQ